jgi:hypothetical protein
VTERRAEQVDQLDESACVELVEALTDWEQKPHEV